MKSYQATVLEQNLYTLTRAARILNCKTQDINWLTPIEGACVVTFCGENRVISKIQFLNSLADERKQRATNLQVTENAFNPNAYGVRNLEKNTLYKVECKATHLICECKDYENQKTNFNSDKVACKHIYAVLAHNGFSSLKEYLRFKYDEQRYQDEQNYRESLRDII